MNPEIYSIVQEMMKQDTKLGIPSDREAHLSVQMGRLLALLGEEAEKNAVKTAKATKWIVRLTWVIAFLTFFLVLTIFFDFPKISVVLNKDRTFKTESNTGKEDKKNIQALPERSQGIQNIKK